MDKLKLEFSFDDGGKYDFKIIELLKKYKQTATFYISTINNLSEPEIVAMSKDFQIGGHTTTHPEDLKQLSPEEQYNEIKDNKDYLEQLIGKEINSFCYPGGEYNKITIEQVKKAGYKEARTTNILYIKEPENKYRKHTTIHIKPDRREYKEKNWLKCAIRLFDKTNALKQGYFHCWGHSKEIIQYNILNEFEKLLKYIYEKRK